jgi:Excalibur calcium-binding domain
MNSATIPLAALATFAAVYWLTPAPAVAPAAEAAAVVATTGAEVVPAAPAAGSAPRTRAGKRARSRSARPHRAVPAAARVPVRRAPEIHFAGCNAVRAAGLAPLYRGQPGYRAGMDGDDDGIACEPYRGLR